MAGGLPDEARAMDVEVVEVAGREDVELREDCGDEPQAAMTAPTRANNPHM